MLVNEDFLDDLPRVDKEKVASPAKFWALYAASFYENGFANISSIPRLKSLYNHKRKHIRNPEALAALNFFYRIRRDEINGDFMWESILLESPDMIEARNLGKILPGVRNLDLTDLQVPFGYYNGKIRLGKINGIHPAIKDLYPDMADKKSYRQDLKYAGRIWIKDRVISFWEYPETHKALYDILSDIENEFPKQFKKHFTINPNNWYIEIVDKRLEGDNFPEYFKDWKDAEDAILIPVRDYKGSGEWSEEQKGKEHVKSPLLKQNKAVPSGFGSGASKYKPLAWRQAMYAENLVPSFKEFLEL